MFAFLVSRVTGLSEHFNAYCLVSNPLYMADPFVMTVQGRSRVQDFYVVLCTSDFVRTTSYRNIVIPSYYSNVMS